MAERLLVTIVLADLDRAEEVAQALADQGDLAQLVPSELEAAAPADVVVSDGDVLDPAIPHVLIGSAAAAAPNVAAVLPADAAASLVAAAVRLAAAGYRLVPPSAANGHAAGAEAAEGALPALTARERETLALLADGASNKLIARKLDISVHTAKFHVAAVLGKLHARNRADAVAIGLRQGLLYL